VHNVAVRVADDKDGHRQAEHEQKDDVRGAVVSSALPIHRTTAITKQRAYFDIFVLLPEEEKQSELQFKREAERVLGSRKM